MKILRGDLEITKNTLEELLKVYNDKLNLEIESGCHIYDTDCPSYDKFQGLVDTLVIVDKYKSEHGLDKR